MRRLLGGLKTCLIGKFNRNGKTARRFSQKDISRPI
jgi:hypothetical protein